MQAAAIGVPDLPSVESDEAPAQALVRLLDQHGLADSARQLLEELEKRKQARKEDAGREVLAYLLEGNEPPTDDEREAIRREWRG